ncbi:MAG: homocysteine S-methyltransferase family protein [Rhodobacteraceae bacterium]|nr:homocysteine S-methyltransferase family protein [Paracoccaceae bacterium]
MTITILDGSIGQELVHRSGTAATPWWSTTVMLEQPELVRQLHADYFAAGADVATTNTYAVLPDRLGDSGFEDKLTGLLNTAAREARAARDAFGSGKVAGSLGPLGASYRTDFSHTREEARELYHDVISTLDHWVDFFLAETVTSIAQARNVVDVIDHWSNKPGWISFSVDDEDGTKLRSGEDLRAALALVDEPYVEAVLINCCRPEAVAAALEILRDAGKPFGAYANGFTKITDAFLEEMPTVDVLTAREDLSPQRYADFVESWIKLGATIVGGCCEVGPAHIAEITRRVRG